jgi:hypothetical protein
LTSEGWKDMKMTSTRVKMVDSVSGYRHDLESLKIGKGHRYIVLLPRRYQFKICG